MKVERPSDINIQPQEDGTVLVTIVLNQTIQWIPRGPGEIGSEYKPFEPPTKKLRFMLCSYDAERIGLDLLRSAEEAVHLVNQSEFNSKASTVAVSTQETFL